MEQIASRCLLVDVRTPGEFESGHIEGSMNAPLGELQRHAPSILKAMEGRDIALVCRTGQRAARAREELAGLTDANLHVLDGGVVAWSAAGHPLTAPTAGAVMSLERQVRITAGALVAIGALLAWFVNPAFVGLSGFVGAGLVFAGMTDTCAMGMLIARMPWNHRAVS